VLPVHKWPELIPFDMNCHPNQNPNGQNSLLPCDLFPPLMHSVHLFNVLYVTSAFDSTISSNFPGFRATRRGCFLQFIYGHPGLPGYYVASKPRFFTPGPIHRISSRDGCYLAMGCLPLNITNIYFILREGVHQYNGRGRGAIDLVYHGSPLLGHRQACMDQRQ
jgi:hypothetical protein